MTLDLLNLVEENFKGKTIQIVLLFYYIFFPVYFRIKVHFFPPKAFFLMEIWSGSISSELWYSSSLKLKPPVLKSFGHFIWQLVLIWDGNPIHVAHEWKKNIFLITLDLNRFLNLITEIIPHARTYFWGMLQCEISIR